MSTRFQVQLILFTLLTLNNWSFLLFLCLDWAIRSHSITLSKKESKKRNRNNLKIQLPNAEAVIKRPYNSASVFNNNNSPFLYSPGSKVGELIYRFETGQHQRRHSLDSSLAYLDNNNNNRQKQYIKDRKYEYKPLVSDWKNRTRHHDLPIRLAQSRSTPIRSKTINIPPPIPEKSLSTTTWTGQ